MTASDLIAALKTMTPAERAEVRAMLGIEGDYHRTEIDPRTGQPKAPDRPRATGSRY